MSESLIELRGVDKSYREGVVERAVLRSADLDVHAGQTAALVGRSGSGKTTLLNLVSGIDAPDAGTVRVAAQSLTELDERGRTELRRRQIGFVFQFFNLIPTLTVEENVLLPLELAGSLDRASQRRALELLERMGLAERRGTFPDVLSGGEQQRVAIARALAHDPPILLADEPTGNLDHDTAETVLELLFTAVREAGKTLLMATHSPAVASRADRRLRLVDGRFSDDRFSDDA